MAELARFGVHNDAEGRTRSSFDGYVIDDVTRLKTLRHLVDYNSPTNLVPELGREWEGVGGLGRGGEGVGGGGEGWGGIGRRGGGV